METSKVVGNKCAAKVILSANVFKHMWGKPVANNIPVLGTLKEKE